MGAERGVLGYGGDAVGAWADVRGSQLVRMISGDLEERGVKCVILGGGGGVFRVVAPAVDSGSLFRLAILAQSRLAPPAQGAA